MKKVFFSLALFSLTVPTVADDLGLMGAKLEAYRKASNYIDAIHCGINLENSSNSFKDKLNRVFHVRSTEDPELFTLYVLLEGDSECLGGSGTSQYYLLQVDQAEHSQLRVVGDVLDLKDENFNSRFMDVTQEGNNLIINSYSHDEDDPNNMPSLQYQFKVALPPYTDPYERPEESKTKPLHILDKKFLGKYKGDNTEF